MGGDRGGGRKEKGKDRQEAADWERREEKDGEPEGRVVTDTSRTRPSRLFSASAALLV